MREESLRRIVIKFVDVNHHRNRSFFRPTRCLQGGCSVASVKVKDAAGKDRVAAQICGGITEPVVVMPQYRSFADFLFKHDDRGLRRGALHDAYILCVETSVAEALKLSATGSVVADGADVTRGQPESSAG